MVYLFKKEIILKLFFRSSAFQNALSRQQQLVDAPKNPLIGEIPTQWISTLTMARRVIEQQNALLAACLDFQDVTLPNFEFLKKILNVRKLLWIFL